MQDNQIEKFFQTHRFMDFGLISHDKPSDTVRLSQVLESTTSEKYFLSPKACAGILHRAEKRGKQLPAILEQALRQVVSGHTEKELEPSEARGGI